jgi:hypothetical protein
VAEAFDKLKADGGLKKWGLMVEKGLPMRRNVMQGELRQVGIKAPEKIAQPSTRNDAAFLATVTLSTSLFAVLAGAVLPGDWGFFTSYSIGGITLVVLAIGSTAPGLLQLAIDSFSLVFPDYKERVIRHEASHFLAGYLCGFPVISYNVLLGTEHTEFGVKMGKRLIERTLEDDEVDKLAIAAVAGIASEGQNYEEVMGQTADLMDLQRILFRSKNKLTDQQQQNMTRWAVFQAGSLLRSYKKEHQALIEAMTAGKR